MIDLTCRLKALFDISLYNNYLIETLQVPNPIQKSYVFESINDEAQNTNPTSSARCGLFFFGIHLCRSPEIQRDKKAFLVEPWAYCLVFRLRKKRYASYINS